MTPGFAKPRSELPWLPYAESDRVIINSHNFTPPGPTLFGGESLVWCPSLDTAGNGTTTLTDFSGNGNHGTLQNFALSGSSSNWIADTANGGTRCLAFDATNDYVSSSVTMNLAASNLSFAAWCYPVAGDFSQIFGQGDGYTTGLYVNIGPDGTAYWQPVGSKAGVATVGQWNHIGLTKSSTTVKLFINGVLQVTTTTWGRTDSTSSFEAGRVKYNIVQYYNGNGKRIDDVRWYASTTISDAQMALLASKRGY